MLKEENINMADIENILQSSELFPDNISDALVLPFDSQNSLIFPTPPQISPPEIAEETLDVAEKYEADHYEQCNVWNPVRGPPLRTTTAGVLNFHVEINALATHKKKYLYSHKLNRIYVDMKINFPVQFRWDFDRAPNPMFVRASTVFADESQAEKRVERCIQHKHDNPSGMEDRVVQNVLHSARDHGTQGVYYCGEPSYPDSWYSVVVQYDNNTTEPYSHAYQFVCKNSCNSGINRRAIEIIFTLEDINGTVYGRQTVGARICACPKRDKCKDELDAEGERPGKKRVVRAPPPPAPEKRIKLELDDDVFTLPPVQIVGHKAMVTGLEVMLSCMEQVAASKSNDQQALEKYNNSIRALRSKIDEMKNTQNPLV